MISAISHMMGHTAAGHRTPHLVSVATHWRSTVEPAAPNSGCLVEVPWLVHGGHGASSRQPLGSPLAPHALASAGVVTSPRRQQPQPLQSKRLLIESRWVSKPLAFAGQPF
eukprot:COSAG01_NODE_25180_length_753_cov_0.863914_1_plen_111_part_00